MKLWQKVSAGFAAVMASGVALAESNGSDLDTGGIVSHLESTVTGDIVTIGGAILIVGGIVYGIGVLRGMFKA